jgi:SAM-dependent methyltransferase
VNEQALREEIVRLAPWHLDVQVTDTLSTAVFLDAELTPEQSRHKVTFIDTGRGWWKSLISSIYPDGLGGRTVLDCACNCGGYSFWMRELGSDGGLGFDVRQQWIDQARFLQQHRRFPSDGLRFEVCDLYDLPSLTDESFDISIFKGIFYHLPDPIHGLKLVADRTRDLLIVNTAARNNFPDGMLVASRESVVHPMSGVHGLNWFPTGPGVISQLLESMGFSATRCSFWHTEPHGPDPTLGRLEVLGARDSSRFEHYDEVIRRRDDQRETAGDRKPQREPPSAAGTDGAQTDS